MAVDNEEAASRRDERTEERMRRRFARRQWARRWGVWRPLLLLVVLVALGGGGVWLVGFSSVLAVEDVVVEGTDFLTAEEVLEAADVQVGVPLARVDTEAVERRVQNTLAPVRRAEVRRDWPHSVTVVVTEREAVAVAEIGGRNRGMDAEGVVFRDYRRAPKDLPRVRIVGDADSEARKQAATVLSALPPDLADLVRRVDVETVDHVSLVLTGDRTVLWGSGEFSEEKAAVLAALLQAQDARRYDVSAPGQPVVSG